MREASAKGPAIDLSEFERRLRGPEPVKKSGHDPLAELARLLHGSEAGAARDPYRDVFDEQPTGRAPSLPRAPSRPQPQPQRPSLQEDEFLGELRGSFEPSLPEPAPPQRRPAPPQRGAAPREFPAQRFEAPQQPVDEPQQSFDAPPQRFEAPPRRFDAPRQSFDAPPQRFDPPPQRFDPPPQRFDPPPQRFEAPPQRFEPPPQRYREQPYEQQGFHDQNGYHDQNPADWSQDESQNYLDYGPREDEHDYDHASEYEGRSRFRPWHAVAGIVAIGAISIGWGFAHRSGGGAPQEIATIAAPDGPAKVPPVAGEGPQEQQGAAVLDRNENATVKNLVTHEEQPVDPTVAPRALRLGAGQGDPQPGDSIAPAQEPKKVKTVSVRPDGSVIANDPVPAAAIARPARTVAPREPLPDDAAPILGGTPKSVAAQPPATTPRAAKPAAKPPVKIAAVPPPQAADGEEAAPGAAEETGAGNGAFAVQFGAAATEAEARALMEKVTSKYGPQLGGRRLGYRHAKVGEKSVYRVRVGGVTRESAVAICEKVKTAGGSCFVAAN